MNFNDLINIALASPPGSILHATYETKFKRDMSEVDSKEDWKIEHINGQKPKEA